MQITLKNEQRPYELIVEGTHAERQEADGALVERHFRRRYVLDDDVEVEKMTSRFEKGALTLHAPRKPKEAPPKPAEKEATPDVIPIKIHFASDEKKGGDKEKNSEEKNDKEVVIS